MRSISVLPPMLLVLTFFVIHNQMGPTDAEVNLTGTWDLTGTLEGGTPFTCTMNLRHSESLSGDIDCTASGSPVSSATIFGSADLSTKMLVFTAQGLFGCGNLQGRASFSAGGNSMSSGAFECPPATIATWVANRRGAVPMPTTTGELPPTAPADGTPATPTDGTQATPTDGTQATPADGTQATPADETPATPTDGTPTFPAEPTSTRPSSQVGQGIAWWVWTAAGVGGTLIVAGLSLVVWRRGRRLRR